MSAAAKRRFFIALLPPQPIQDQATEIQQYFADRYASCAAQKSPPHITLQPPFEWQEEHLPQLIQSLEEFAATQATVPIQLAGFAAFPPRVIFIHVHQTPALLALQQTLATWMEAQWGLVDTRARGRVFTPHMTVAFRDLTRQNFQLAWQEFEGRSLVAEFVASHLVLLIHTGQRWVVYRELPLQGRSPYLWGVERL